MIVPQFPTPKGQNLENWMKVMQPHFKKIGKDTILIGHSVGVAFLLALVEKLNVKVKGLFSVAGFVGSLWLHMGGIRGVGAPDRRPGFVARRAAHQERFPICFSHADGLRSR